jgi:protein-tyrosine phosphatase
MADRFSFQPLAPAARPDGRPGVTEILPNLLIGEYPTPEDIDWLKTTMGITAVVCLQDDADLAGKQLTPARLHDAYVHQGLAFRRMPVADGNATALAAELQRIVRIIHEYILTGDRVYVHCNAGMNRAPTVAIAYLHVHEEMSLSDARDYVKERRLCLPYMSVLKQVYGSDED